MLHGRLAQRYQLRRAAVQRILQPPDPGTQISCVHLSVQVDVEFSSFGQQPC